MRKLILAFSFMLASVTASVAQVSVSIGVPVVSIGFNVPVYPQLVRVSGYPVYYAPRLRANYFFYDGLYWVYRGGSWYASHWYNGPWSYVEPDAVPLYVLRVPVRYYYDRPALFNTWYVDAAPQWNVVWGSSWEQRHSGWNQWNRNDVPAAAPLPTYQRQYAGNRYPRAEQQTALQTRNYRYQPREAVARQFYQARGAQVASVAPQTREQARARMGTEQTTVAQQQAMLRNEARARKHDEARATRQQEARVIARSRELAATTRADARVARQQDARVLARSQELAATARAQEVRVSKRAQELNAAAQQREFRPTKQQRHEQVAAQQREFRPTRQHPEQMITQQPREAKAPKHGRGTEQMVMRQEQQAHGPKGGGGGGHGGDHHGGGKGDKGGGKGGKG